MGAVTHSSNLLAKGDAPQKPRLRVVAAAMFDDAGRVLIAQRPEGKHMAGWWEFPGGKVATGESDPRRLVRELREELGVETRPASEVMTLTHDYPDRIVDLVLWRATDLLDGAPRGARRSGTQVGGLSVTRQ